MAGQEGHSVVDRFELRLREAAGGLGLCGGVGRKPLTVGVALSGGADSVAMLVGLHRIGCDVVALHCNFGLRGEESDGDSFWCHELTDRLGIRMMSVRFDVSASRREGESVEMVCRRLRYAWFEKMAADLGLQAVAIGHHCEDSAETVLLNLFRGTGLKGLRGIMPERGIFVRPMLGMFRAEIESYLDALGLGYRTDSTNLGNDYRRNAIRNEIMPVIRRYFPGGMNGVLKTAGLMRMEADAMEDYADWLESRYVAAGGSIDIASMINDLRSPENALFHLLERRSANGVSFEVARDIVRSASRSGLRFGLGDGTIMELSRGSLMYYERNEDVVESEVTLEQDIVYPVGIKVDYLSKEEFGTARKDARTAFFDSSVLNGMPRFLIRRWRHGDRLKPFGMAGSRKVSDIFSDMKMTVGQKNRQWILTRDGELLWIVGVRASRLFMVTPASDRIIRLTFQSEN